MLNGDNASLQTELTNANAAINVLNGANANLQTELTNANVEKGSLQLNIETYVKEVAVFHAASVFNDEWSKSSSWSRDEYFTSMLNAFDKLCKDAGMNWKLSGTGYILISPDSQ